MERVREGVDIDKVPVNGRVTGVVHTMRFEETDLVVGLGVGDNFFEFKPSETVDPEGCLPED